MYPMLKEGVSIGTFQYDDSETIHYYIENADGNEFEISRRLWLALIKADGTRPLNLPNRGRKLLPALKKYGLVQTSRFIWNNGIIGRCILLPIGSRIQNSISLYKVINTILPVIAVLIFTMGAYLMTSSNIEIGYNVNWSLYYSLLICSLVLHEAGHLVAGLAYGYKISDIGILLFGIIPIGAYVAHEDKKDATKAEKIQFALAGIELNLLVAGVCFLVAVYLRSPTMSAVANINIFFSCINLLPASGLDGEHALSAVCEVNSINKVARKWLVNKKRRNKLFHSGILGYICLSIFVFSIISNIIILLLICLNIICVFFSIF